MSPASLAPNSSHEPNYFGIVEDRQILANLDGWIRRKIRDILWRQWKKPKTRYLRLKGLGIKETTAKQAAYSSKGPWRMAITYAMHRAVGNEVIKTMGYIPMVEIGYARFEQS